jgi:TM2 domain-containing membrane protein YozV
MAGRKYCWHCGAETAEAAIVCVDCQAQLPHAQPLYQPPRSDKKLLAGLLALLIPGLGIHKFVLGYNTEGVVMLLVTILTCGIGAIVMVPISMIEGIIYLTKSDEEFDLVYVQNRRGWF